jgi:hypothetical protein
MTQSLSSRRSQLAFWGNCLMSFSGHGKAILSFSWTREQEELGDSSDLSYVINGWAMF